MRRNRPWGFSLRRTSRVIYLGLMYVGANAWPDAHPIRAGAAPPAGAARRREERPAGRPAPDRVTPYEDLTDAERHLLMELDRRFERETGG